MVSERDAKAADEVIACYSARVSRMFDLYCRRLMAKRFTAFRLLNSAPELPEGRNFVLYSNHSSWYDPLLLFVLARDAYPQQTAFGPMDAEALAKYGFMKKIGIFGVEQGSARGAARFLQVSRGLLAHPNHSMLITPQGEFADVRQRPVRFEPGLGHLARDCGALAIPLAVELVYWNEGQAELLAHFGEPVDTAARELKTDAWTHELEGALSRVQDELAEASMSRDPDLFTTFIDGSTGVNPIYDGWRFLKALIKGEKFSTAHSDITKNH